MKVCVSEQVADYSERWDRFVETAENATVFTGSRWTSSVARLSGAPIHRVTVTDGAGEILGGVVFAVRRLGPIAMARKPWATPYCGPVFQVELASADRLKAGEALARHLKTHYDYVRIDTGVDFHDLIAFQDAAWRVRVRNTYRLERPAGSMADCFEPSVRRHMNKMERLGLKVTTSINSAPLYRMYSDLYLRQRRPIHFNHEAFHAFCSSLISSGLATILYIEDSAGPFAGALMARWRDKHFYTLSAYRREAATSAGPTLLITRYLTDCVSQSEVFDFVGANTETPGINAFKRSFNPRECPYLSLERCSLVHRLCAPGLSLLSAARSVAVRATQRLRPALKPAMHP
jgi:hypothetical protein